MAKMEKLTAKSILAGETAAVQAVENSGALASAKALASAVAKAKKEYKASVVATLATPPTKGKTPTAIVDDEVFVKLATEMRQLAQAEPDNGALAVSVSGWCDSIAKLFNACHPLKQLQPVKAAQKIIGYTITKRRVSAEVEGMATTLAALMQRFPDLFARVLDVSGCLNYVEEVERTADEVAALKARNARLDQNVDKLRQELAAVDARVADMVAFGVDAKVAKATGKAKVRELDAAIAALVEEKAAPLAASNA